MKSQKSRWLKKVIAIAMVMMLAATPLTPIANVVNIGTSITASAADAEVTTFDATALNDNVENIMVQVFDEEGQNVALLDGTCVIKKGYSVVSNARLTFTGVGSAKPAEYLPDEDGNAYPDRYWYDFTKQPTTDRISVNHFHTLETKTDNRLMVKCTGLEGSEYQSVAHINVNDGYVYGEKVEIAAQVDTEKYGEVSISQTPVYYNKDINGREEFYGEKYSLASGVRTEIGEYAVTVGVNFKGAVDSGDNTFQLKQKYAISKKSLADLTAYVDLDGAETEYDEAVETALPKITYNGKEYTPTVRLVYNNFWNGTTTEDSHEVSTDEYTASITPGKNAGEYTITLTAKEDSNFKNTKTIVWNIDKATMELGIEGGDEFIYNGANTVDETAFVVSGVPEGSSDAVFTYTQNGEAVDKPTEVGTYTVKATYTNPNYNNGEITKDFQIVARDVKVTPDADQKVTYGEAIPEEITYTVEQAEEGGTTGLVAGDEITGNLVAVNGSGYLNAGSYDYVLTELTEEYTNYNIILDDTNKFTVAKKALTKDMFTVSDREKTYNKEEQAVTVTASDSVTVSLEGADPYEMPPLKELLSDADWTVVDNTDRATAAGNYTVTVAATEGGNYTGEVVLDKDDQKWKISPKSIKAENITVTVTNDNSIYTGEPITADIVVKDGDDTLVIVEDYTIDDAAQSTTQTNAGTYTFTVKGEGNYTDTTDVSWTIQKATVDSLEISGETTVIYDGESVEGEYTVSGAPEDSDYTYNYQWSADGGDTWTDGAPVNSGSYKVKASATSSVNYNDAETEAFDFEITKRQVGLYPEEFQSWEYGTKEEDITIAYDVETAVEGGSTGLVGNDTKDLFTNVFKLKDYTGNVGYYDIIADETVALDNYTAVYDYPIQAEITKKKLTPEMFEITDDSEFVYDGNKKVVEVTSAKDGETDLEEGLDYTTSGTFSAYVPGTYKVNIDGGRNYEGQVTKEWTVQSNKSVTARTVAESYVYNGQTPEVSVVANEGTQLPAKNTIVYKYSKLVGEEWVDLDEAPVSVGTYKVQGVVTARGYDIEVLPVEFTISQREVAISVVPSDLNGVYGEDEYKVTYIYDETVVLDEDKADDFVTGEIAIVGDITNVTYDENGNIVGNELDFSALTVNNENYKLVLPEGQKFFLSPRDVADGDIQFTNSTVTLKDIGATAVEFKVIVNGKELEKGTDYDVAGTFATTVEGNFNVQVLGKGNYTGLAVAGWSAAVSPEEKAAAVSEMNRNVTVELSNPTSVKAGGKERVSVDVTATVGDYNATKIGVVYYNGAEENYDETKLTLENVDNVNYFSAVKNNATEYTYGIPDIGNGIHAIGFVVVNDNSYEAVKYSNLWKLSYDGENEEIEETIELNKTAINIGLEQEYALTATVTPATLSQKVEWTTSDETIATVDENGIITGVSLGTVYITATSANGATAVCKVNVKKAPSSISLDKSELTLHVHSNYIFTKTLSSNSATAFKWTSSDPEVARVYSNGKVVAQQEGVTTITVTTHNGLTASCVLTVLPLPEEEPVDPVDPGNDPVDPGNDPVDPGNDPVDPGNPPEDV